ncbi:Aste57867_9007 [Aphanomyces stellatus]|uniref:Aste57867_9007 protein n=1 Tax=Aphanomyces stellatus TaxID=120398 RepID=A0A485KLY5_9STRA|nr:hypothetical protein As57867_008972 [Aphanomyces stellatus]VFT85891.1 Aste57867_9007 [Aphanomyces stellatus]
MAGQKREGVPQVASTAKKAKGNPVTKAINRTWDDLVKMTQAHARFNEFFKADPSWVSTQTMKPSSKAKYRKIVAMDCEMCVTMHEETEARNPKALVRVTLIDGEDPDEILVDLIVHQPAAGHFVFNYKTDIHGIAKETIDASKISQDRARKEVLKYIGPDTIVVGHSVNGDLKSVGVAHQRVIDTALLYERKGVSDRLKSPGLRDLTKQLLGVQMAVVHDSFLDAKMTMLAAKYTLTHECGAVIAPESKAHKADAIGGATEDEAKEDIHWLVHKIPKGLFNSDIEQFAIKQTAIVPTMVENIVFKSQWGTCSVYFRGPEHATLAFETIEGKKTPASAKVDALDRPTKVVDITNATGKKFSNIRLVKVTKK